MTSLSLFYPEAFVFTLKTAVKSAHSLSAFCFPSNGWGGGVTGFCRKINFMSDPKPSCSHGHDCVFETNPLILQIEFNCIDLKASSQASFQFSQNRLTSILQRAGQLVMLLLLSVTKHKPTAWCRREEPRKEWSNQQLIQTWSDWCAMKWVYLHESDGQNQKLRIISCFFSLSLYFCI